MGGVSEVSGKIPLTVSVTKCILDGPFLQGVSLSHKNITFRSLPAIILMNRRQSFSKIYVAKKGRRNHFCPCLGGAISSNFYYPGT